MEDRQMSSKNQHNSSVTITEKQFEDENDKLFLKSLATLDPELWRIKMYLMETGINPVLIPAIIDQLRRVDAGSGYGQVTVHIREHRAVKVEGTDSRLLDLNLS